MQINPQRQFNIDQTNNSSNTEVQQNTPKRTIIKASLIALSALGFIVLAFQIKNIHNISQSNPGLGFFERP